MAKVTDHRAGAIPSSLLQIVPQSAPKHMSNDDNNANAQAKKPKASHVRGPIIITLILGLAGSFFLSRPLEQSAALSWAAQAEADAERLGRTFMLLLDHSNGPLQSLATVFNGSGRVAADEFDAQPPNIRSAR